MTLTATVDPPPAPPPRTEFGRARSVCSCAVCRLNCRAAPGVLVPADLDRLAPPGDVLAWAAEHLLASPGARLRVNLASGPAEIRAPSLVPAVRGDGSCRWYDLATGRCGVHAASPFGCAFFSCADGPTGRDPAADDFVKRGYVAILNAWDERPESAYARVWRYLDGRGFRAEPVDAARDRVYRRMAAARDPHFVAVAEAFARRARP